MIKFKRKPFLCETVPKKDQSCYQQKERDMDTLLYIPGPSPLQYRFEWYDHKKGIYERIPNSLGRILFSREWKKPCGCKEKFHPHHDFMTEELWKKGEHSEKTKL